MKKNLIDKKINRYIRGLNKTFNSSGIQIRQLRKKRENGIQQYIYKVKDMSQNSPSTSIYGWLNDLDILWFHKVEEEIDYCLTERKKKNLE